VNDLIHSTLVKNLKGFGTHAEKELYFPTFMKGEIK
jgi:hypothetical protein